MFPFSIFKQKKKFPKTSYKASSPMITRTHTPMITNTHTPMIRSTSATTEIHNHYYSDDYARRYDSGPDILDTIITAEIISSAMDSSSSTYDNSSSYDNSGSNDFSGGGGSFDGGGASGDW